MAASVSYNRRRTHIGYLPDCVAGTNGRYGTEGQLWQEVRELTELLRTDVAFVALRDVLTDYGVVPSAEAGVRRLGVRRSRST
jgi:hypothetical protein